MVILSQEKLSSQSEYEPSEDGLASQDEASGCEDQTVKRSFGKQRVFLTYEQKLQELLRFCPKCGMLIEQESIQEVKNEGSQLSLRLNCLNNCKLQMEVTASIAGYLSSAGIFLFSPSLSPFQSWLTLSALVREHTTIYEKDMSFQLWKQRGKNNRQKYFLVWNWRKVQLFWLGMAAVTLPPNIDHQFDPWHISKSVKKKVAAASKKSGCSDLAPWIPSLVNHLWWSAESCGNDPEDRCWKISGCQSFITWPTHMNGQAKGISTSANTTRSRLIKSKKRNGWSWEVYLTLHWWILWKTSSFWKISFTLQNLCTQQPWKFIIHCFLKEPVSVNIANHATVSKFSISSYFPQTNPLVSYFRKHN